MALLILGRLKYIQLINQHLYLVPFRSRQLSVKRKSPGTDQILAHLIQSEV